jgi:hypothetical protein
MRRFGTVPWLLGLALLPSTGSTHPALREEVGSMVSVSVEIEGRTSPLYAAPDGSGRFYLEALPHARYALRLANRTHERLGVTISVDGLNAISGERDAAARPRPAPIGRMYVLYPWESITVRGWRTSLEEVRRFTFVDEQRSYATRSGKANAKMGWIELAVYRERQPSSPGVTSPRGRDIPPPYAPPAMPGAPERSEGAEADQGRSDDGASRGRPEVAAPNDAGREAAAPRSFPGTGWGERAGDSVMLVDFDPMPQAGERVTLRYEYAAGLRALGIDVRPWLHARDRLRERDRGEGGFAKPPAW